MLAEDPPLVSLAAVVKKICLMLAQKFQSHLPYGFFAQEITLSELISAGGETLAATEK